jgi:hypothetical protein
MSLFVQAFVAPACDGVFRPVHRSGPLAKVAELADALDLGCEQAGFGNLLVHSAIRYQAVR